MNCDGFIRFARTEDAAAIVEIYGPYCLENSPVSFELVPPSLEDMEHRIREVLMHHPWLVFETSEGIIAGYAYATSHKQRAAYRWCVDSSVYLAQAYQGKGIGKALYSALFRILELQGYYNVYAGVTLPNKGSESLHLAFGFQLVGLYRNVGYKGGAWRDVAWYQMKLREHDATPAEPKGIADICQTQLSSLVALVN